MKAKTIISLILGVTLLVAVAKWNVQPEQGLEPQDLTKVIENEQKLKYEWNQEEQEKIKQQEFFPLPNKQKLPRNTENIYERRKKHSVIHPHLNKQLIHAKQESELLQENFAHWYSHNVEIIAESESGSRFAEGSGVIESTTQRVTQTYTTPEGSGDIETTRETVTIIFTTAEGSGEGPGDLKTTLSSTTDIFTTPEGSGEGSGDLKTPSTTTDIFTTPEGSGEGSGDLKTPSTTTDIFTTPEGSGDIEKTPQTTTENFTTQEGPGGRETTLYTDASSTNTAVITNSILTPEFLSTTPGSSATDPLSSIPATSTTITAVNNTTTSPIGTFQSSTTRPVGLTTPYCQHGGSYSEGKCICPNFIGEFCETPSDRVVIGKTVLATVMVEMKITNRAYQEVFQNTSSNEYKEFEAEFIKEMYIYYSNIDEYVGVVIKEIRSGSGSARKGGVIARSADVSARSDAIIVNHDVNFRLPLNKDLNMTSAEYNTTLQILKEQLEILKQCTDDNSGFCIDGDSLNIIRVELKTVEELCMETIPEGFKEFYSPYFFTDEELTCISDCVDSSGKYKSCNEGTCKIRNQTGRACLCPDTDIYLYMYSNCKGPILKTGVYGGVGAAIAVLCLALITVTYLLFKRGKDKKRLEPFAIDQEDNWSEENDSEWHVDRGITNFPANMYETNGDSSNNISSGEKFKPVLDKIDTTIEIKIQRPEVARL